MALDGGDMQEALLAGRIQWRRHALERMFTRRISRSEVVDVLRQNDRIESYPDSFPFPSALFSGTINGRVLHVVAAFDGRPTVYVISTYEPDEEHFEPDLRTRRRID